MFPPYYGCSSDFLHKNYNYVTIFSPYKGKKGVGPFGKTFDFALFLYLKVAIVVPTHIKLAKCIEIM